MPLGFIVCDLSVSAAAHGHVWCACLVLWLQLRGHEGEIFGSTPSVVPGVFQGLGVYVLDECLMNKPVVSERNQFESSCSKVLVLSTNFILR